MTEAEKDELRRGIADLDAFFYNEGVQKMTWARWGEIKNLFQTLIDTQPTMGEFQKEVKR